MMDDGIIAPAFDFDKICLTPLVGGTTSVFMIIILLQYSLSVDNIYFTTHSW